MMFNCRVSFLFAIFFLASCSSSNLLYENRNYIARSDNSTNNKTILFLNATYDTFGNSMTSEVPNSIQNQYYNIFSKYGFTKFHPSRESKYPDYIAIMNGSCQEAKGVATTPIVGRTGINSINTTYSSNTFGTSFNNYYSGTTYGSARSTVNYNYGVVGYKRTPYAHFIKNISFVLVSFNKDTKKPSSDIIYQSNLFMEGVNSMDCSLQDDAYLLSNSDNKFIDKLNSSNISCYYSNEKNTYICNPDNGFFANFWGKIFHSELYD